MVGNDLTAQDASAISDMMICLEELDVSGNKLGEHGAELLSEGITNTKTMRVLDIRINNIGSPGTTAIANALSENIYIYIYIKRLQLYIGVTNC